MTGMATSSGAAQSDSTAALEAYVRALLDGCAAALSTLLGRSVVTDLELPLLPPSESVTTVMPPPWFICEARFTRGVAGAHDFIFPEDDAVTLARLVLGDESSEPTAVTSDHHDALREMLSQMLSSASSALRVFLDRATALSLVEVRHVEGTEGWTPHTCTVAIGRFLIDGVPRARVAVTIPVTVRDEVSAHMGARATAGREAAGPATAGLEMILDITMPITVELGRTRMLIRDILSLGPGSVVELDKLAGEPVDLLINDRPIAKGEVVVIDESFGVRLTQISQPAERIRSLT